MLAKLRKSIQEFVASNKEYPIIFALAAGLYSFLYVYHSNFMLVNSAFQFVVIFSVYILLPIVVFTISWEIIKRVKFLTKFAHITLPVLNAAFFCAYFAGRINGFHQKKIILAYIIGFSLLAIVLRKHYKKIVVIQFLMALVAFVTLLPTLFRATFDSDTWLTQPDAIVETEFNKFPNIYIIQPDGYVNFSELEKAPYNFQNEEFEAYLENSGFKLYTNFRSNYTSTVLSNSSMFGMKHHYKGEQLFGAREVIAGNNPVIEIFKNNGYETFLFMQNPYLLLNRPTIAYDSCNFTMDEVPWFGIGAFSINKKLIQPVAETIKKQQGKRSFYFIEKITPGHITTFKNQALGKEIERENYLESVKEANEWLKEITSVIIKNDPNGLIVIAADHGGYVGLNYTKELFEKQTDKALIYSSFSAALAIKWPNNTAPTYDAKLKTPVNLFRTLFTYLGDNEALLENLQDDKSYSIIKKNAPTGVYEYIDNDGNMVFKKVE
ncbi:sulfatase-like hydrolase/transferase [Kordia jejudonensis]|uniref:sulfatase-like hydrolase/transferase n=1 Tax=Kordia jejudonensis TaxID=1348245 RepID=UPI0006290D58|nr:sulfatase-like hydrolase/transferase [Kordia jejudonensis]